jgi:hypothetical protein
MRGGLVLVAAVVCLAIVIALVSGMLVGTLRVRRHLTDERNVRQCELMLEAGADRAAHRLAAEAEYRGEIWELPADSITGRDSGQVTIEISRGPWDARRHVRVLAEYPTGSQLSVRRSRTYLIQSPMTQAQE